MAAASNRALDSTLANQSLASDTAQLLNATAHLFLKGVRLVAPFKLYTTCHVFGDICRVSAVFLQGVVCIVYHRERLRKTVLCAIRAFH